MGGGPLNVRDRGGGGGGGWERNRGKLRNWGGRQDLLTIPLDHIVEVKGTNQCRKQTLRWGGGGGGRGEGLPKKPFGPLGLSLV